MNVIDTLAVDHVGTDSRTMVLCGGDIASIPSHINLQYLVISGSPGHYTPEENPFVAELDCLGVEVAALERNHMRYDFRPSLPCWVTESLNLPGIHFQYLLAWEPVLAPEAAHRLDDVQYACQALARLEGYSGGRSAMFLLWPPTGEEIAPDIFRMQFFSAMAMAGRARWQTVYLMVPPDFADIATDWFSTLKALYIEPPLGLNSSVSPESMNVVLPESAGAHGQRNDGRITARQFRAINAYTVGSYVHSRRALRHNNPRHAEFIRMQPLIEATSTGLAGLPNHQGDRVIRAFDLHEHPENYYQDGYETLELAYCSTSMIALPYGKWLLRMYSSLGKDISMYSNFPTEYEVLFDHAMTLVVTCVEPLAEGTGEVFGFERIPADVGVRETHL